MTTTFLIARFACDPEKIIRNSYALNNSREDHIVSLETSIETSMYLSEGTIKTEWKASTRQRVRCKVRRHQRHRLNDTKPVLKAPVEQCGVAIWDKDARTLKLLGCGNQCF